MGKTEGYSIRLSLRGSMPAGGVMEALMKCPVLPQA
jgi:hypothetical protein